MIKEVDKYPNYAVHPDHQGKGICKVMMTELLDQYERLGIKDIDYLTTQTWRYKAINIFKEFGFRPFNDNRSDKFKGSAGDYEIHFDKAWQIIDDQISKYQGK